MLIDRFIGCLFLCLCALLWFVIIPQQVSGEEQAMYPRLTIIFLAIPALLMALRTTGKNISLGALAKAFSNSSDSAYSFSCSELRRLYHEHGVRRLFCN